MEVACKRTEPLQQGNSSCAAAMDSVAAVIREVVSGIYAGSERTCRTSSEVKGNLEAGRNMVPEIYSEPVYAHRLNRNEQKIRLESGDGIGRKTILKELHVL